MLSTKINSLLNKQIELEASSSHVYLSMASWAEVQGFEGISQFLYKHSDEERMHMLKLMRFVNERGGYAQTPALKAEKSKYKNVTELFEDILKHELLVTAEINNLVDATLKEKDYSTHNFLQWYVTEQIEEERLARTILDKLNLIGNDKSGLYMFDRDLMGMAGQEADGAQ